MSEFRFNPPFGFSPFWFLLHACLPPLLFPFLAFLLPIHIHSLLSYVSHPLFPHSSSSSHRCAYLRSNSKISTRPLLPCLAAKRRRLEWREDQLVAPLPFPVSFCSVTVSVSSCMAMYNTVAPWILIWLVSCIAREGTGFSDTRIYKYAHLLDWRLIQGNTGRFGPLGVCHYEEATIASSQFPFIQ